ncbi:MAG: hypothetical protein VKJ44_01450 [Synechococcus sp.]|nr:hypothetical protein [Synechococcus sp.]
MQFHARLVHAETGRRVVQVSARRNDQLLGSALGEATTAEAAEDRALQRLRQRLCGDDDTAGAAHHPRAGALRPPADPRALHNTIGSDAAAVPERDSAIDPEPLPAPRRATAAAERLTGTGAAHAPMGGIPEVAPSRSHRGQQASDPAADPDLPGAVTAGPPTEAARAVGPLDEPATDPEDWSQELTALDLQLRRLGWNRQQEGLYLQRAFQHPSRSRLTRYSDLQAYLQALEGLAAGTDPALAPVPLRRADLLALGDDLLVRLGWSAERGRAFLERHLQRISRRQLSDAQLLHFNMLLESELLAGPTAPAPDRPEPEPGAQAFTVDPGQQR